MKQISSLGNYLRDSLVSLSLVLTMSGSLLMLSSCSKSSSDPNPLPAPVQPSEVQTVEQLLLAPSNGFEMAVYPSNNQRFGGYTLFVRFAEDGTVQAASELLAGSPVESSKYKVTPAMAGTDAKAIISVATGNKALSLTTTDNAITDELTPYSDEAFRVVSASKEEIKLVGQKNGSVAFLRPADAEAWDVQVQKIVSSRKDFPIKRFNIQNAESKRLGTGELQKRQLTTMIGSEGNSYPFRYTVSGIELFQQVNIGGLSAKSFSHSTVTSEPVLMCVESGLRLFPQTEALSAYLQRGAYDLSAENTKGRANTAITTIQTRMSKLLDPITFKSLTFGTKDKAFGIHVDAEQKNFLGKVNKITFSLPFLIEVIGPNEVKLTFNAGSITGGENAAENSALYNYTFGGNYRFDILAAAFANVKDIKVGKKVYYEDGNYDGRTFRITADNAFSPTKITLTDTSDAENIITLVLSK